jgi:ferritin-like metal-binding protein YciE
VPAEIRDTRQLFLHELGDILFVERRLTDEVLPKLIDEVKDRELWSGLKRHHSQTRKHAANVERVFAELGEEPKAEECLGFEGLKSEHEELAKEVSPDLVDVIDTGAAARTEHYEIAAYDGLIAMARSLKEPRAVALLEENLKEDKDALLHVTRAAKRLAREQAKESL